MQFISATIWSDSPRIAAVEPDPTDERGETLLYDLQYRPLSGPARGYAPAAIALPPGFEDAPPILAHGGELKATGTWQNGEVTDPLTREKRRISGQRPQTLNLNFRQDLPEQKLTWGLGWFGGWEEDYYRLEEVQSLRLRNFFTSFIEYKPTSTFTLRAELNNLDPYRFSIYRFIYDGPRDTGAIDTIEQELRKSQVIGMLSVRWTLG